MSADKHEKAATKTRTKTVRSVLAELKKAGCDVRSSVELRSHIDKLVVLEKDLVRAEIARECKRSDSKIVNDALFGRIIDIVCSQLNVSQEQCLPSARIADDLGADSMSAIELVMALEEELGIAIPEEATFGIVTLGDMWRALKRMGL